MGHQKTALITGASSGIGTALAFELAGHGYNLILMARREDLLKQLQTEVQKKNSTIRVVVYATDVANFEKHMNDVKEVARGFASLDLAIANAGVGYTTDEATNCWEKNKRTFDVNLLGAVATLEAAKDITLKQGYGHLVGIVSMAAHRGIPLCSSYSGSKAGFSAFLESMRIDLSPTPITVTAIYPGYIDTPMTEKNGHMPWLMSAEKAVQIIWKGLKKKKARIMFPWQMKFLMMFLKYIPSCLYDFLLKRQLSRTKEFRKNRE